MAAGSRPPRLNEREHRRVTAAVEAAERNTGLQFCVYVGPAGTDTRAHAEDVFIEAGFHQLPAILILVAHEQRRVEVVTSPMARSRVDDTASSAAVAAMTGYFRRRRLTAGIVIGVQMLARAAGPGMATPEGNEPLPQT